MGKLFTFLAMAVLCFGLVSAQATINGTLTLVHEDVVVMVNITAPIEWIEPEAIVEKSVDCTPLQITGLPQVIQSGEKVSYSMRETKEMFNYFKELAFKIDQHLIANFFINERYVSKV